MNNSRGRENANLVPLMELTQKLLERAIRDHKGKMLDISLNNTLAVSGVSVNGMPRRQVRVLINEKRFHVAYGMDELHKPELPKKVKDTADLADAIYNYLLGQSAPTQSFP